jgi:hypothetical protein
VDQGVNRRQAGDLVGVDDAIVEAIALGGWVDCRSCKCVSKRVVVSVRLRDDGEREKAISLYNGFCRLLRMDTCRSLCN